MAPFKRTLLKVSGEGLSSLDTKMLSFEKVSELAKDIRFLLNTNREVAIIIGGGNICRGANNKYKANRFTIDNIGMLSTVINGCLLTDMLIQNNIPAVLLSTLDINKVADFYRPDKTEQMLQKGKVPIIVGGVACSFFSTDTAAAVRAGELQCNSILKATQVSGVFDKDPNKFDDAKKYDTISYNQVIDQGLQVMDLTSVIIAKTTNIPIYVFNMHENNPIENLVNNKLEHTIITN